MLRKEMKKGGMELSFGMIFAIILIAVFLFVAFYAIKFFLNMQCTVSEGQFVKDLNNYVHRMWESQGITEESEFKGTIGGFCGVKEICFVNPDMEKPQKGEFKEEYDGRQGGYDVGDNVFFYPIKSAEFGHAKIENLNLEVLNPNPYCIKFEDGKASIKLKKNSQEELVRVVIG
jgi:hypothetical protein